MAWYNICFAYWKCGEQDKALEQARKLPNLYKTRENALIYFLQGEERRRVAGETLTTLASLAEMHRSVLAETEGDPETP